MRSHQGPLSTNDYWDRLPDGAPRHDYSCNLQTFQDLELTDFYSRNFLPFPDLCGTIPFGNSHLLYAVCHC